MEGGPGGSPGRLSLLEQGGLHRARETPPQSQAEPAAGPRRLPRKSKQTRSLHPREDAFHPHRRGECPGRSLGWHHLEHGQRQSRCSRCPDGSPGLRDQPRESLDHRRKAGAVEKSARPPVKHTKEEEPRTPVIQEGRAHGSQEQQEHSKGEDRAMPPGGSGQVLEHGGPLSFPPGDTPGASYLGSTR